MKWNQIKYYNPVWPYFCFCLRWKFGPSCDRMFLWCTLFCFASHLQDKLLQKVVTTAFAERTVLTIAVGGDVINFSWTHYHYSSVCWIHTSLWGCLLIWILVEKHWSKYLKRWRGTIFLIECAVLLDVMLVNFYFPSASHCDNNEFRPNPGSWQWKGSWVWNAKWTLATRRRDFCFICPRQRRVIAMGSDPTGEHVPPCLCWGNGYCNVPQ